MLSDKDVEKIVAALTPIIEANLPGTGLGAEGSAGAGGWLQVKYERPGVVASRLGVSVSTLKRRRQQGYFKEGRDFITRQNQGNGELIYLYDAEQCCLHL